MTAMDIPDTGPEAIKAALASWTPERLKSEGTKIIRSGKKSGRTRAIAMLNLAEGLKRNSMTGEDLMVHAVPVLPTQFRPMTIMGDRVTQGDSNTLYQELHQTKEAYKEAHGMLGDAGTADDKLRLFDAVRACYGYGEPTDPKHRAQGVTGFIHKVTGTSPKSGFVQSKLLSKPMDTVGRGVITPDPDLSMDEVSIPEEMAWDLYGPHVQRRMALSGISPVDTLKHLKDRSSLAQKALSLEMGHRPVLLSRSPAWHRHNVVALRPRMHGGSHIAISPAITAGISGDFDGDQVNIHAPATEDSRKEAWDKLLPSKMLHSVRDGEQILPTIKHEQVLGLNSVTARPAKTSWKFKTREEAVKAIESGKVDMSDEVSLE